ncbi:hypothetical protein [Dyadobacter jiangsuensis]|uniref:Carboxypeptidase family protein n=1 Tax=Dyadobacter jiangsuensis TaxID=1591085 RepID=A0A2P8G0G4_9BACT|nr:hypothetical protein [Dyadobacter jiangsuensis]PSL27459.1 hypothetical protein CLV60_108317 [Dyadobacter jiangsuensis]
MKLIGIILFFAAAMSMCEKSTYNDLSGSKIMSGRVLMKDTINGVNYTVPVKSIEVFLADLANTSTFLNSKRTDKDGSYTFEGIDPAVGYKVYAKIDTGAIKYEGELTYKIGEFREGQGEPMMLYPSQSTQNGIHVIVQDTSKARLSNMVVWGYSNSSFYHAGGVEGKTFELTTNLAGVANKMNLAPQTYYLLIKGRVGNIDVLARGTTVVEAEGIKTIVLTVATNPKGNGMEIQTIDVSQAPIQAATVFVYQSQTIYDLDKTGANSVFSMSSDKSGSATAYNIDPAAYYLRAIKIVGKDTLRGQAVTTVKSNEVTKQTLTLK